MNSARLRKATFSLTFLSILPHIFCCGIPVFAAIVALGTTVGLGAALASNPFYSFVDAYHIQFLSVAIAGVALSGILNVISYRVDCRAAACTHGNCAPKKLKSFRIFLISLTLLILDISWFVTEKYLLNLHNHSEIEHEEPSNHKHGHGNHAHDHSAHSL